ncbi:MAG: squalene/phytoene synthase family protein [Acidobacteriota bacterium]|nr:squalene/phytoene synthase family protein [Acidobacteriota bacterium]
MNIDAAYAQCRAIAHKHGANFSVGFRFLPKVKRRAVYAAYAYCRVADDIADDEDPGVILSREDGEGPSPIRREGPSLRSG